MKEEKIERAIEIKNEIAKLEKRIMAVGGSLSNGYNLTIHISYRNDDRRVSIFPFMMFDDIEKIETLVEDEIDFIDSKIAELKKQFREL